MRKKLLINLLIVIVEVVMFFSVLSCEEGLFGDVSDLKELAAEANGGGTNNAQKPEIIEQPKSAGYSPGATAVDLSVTALVDDGGNLTYQWYQNTSNTLTGGEEIEDATESAYNPSTAEIGKIYYWVVITNTNNAVNGTKTATTVSDIVLISVSVNAQTPAISAQPQNITCAQSASVSLSVTAEVSDDGILSYQWYRNTESSTTTGTITPVGTDSGDYAPVTSTSGVYYYYVVVTNTNNAVSGTKTATVTSNVVFVAVDTTVNAQTPNITVGPAGATYNQNAGASAMTVTVSVTDGGTLSHEWFRNTTGGNSEGTSVGTGSTYTPSTSATGTSYYYVVVTNTNNSVNGEKIATATSNAATITVVAVVNAATPVITVQPVGANYSYEEGAAPLSVTATSPDFGALSYKWFRNTQDSTTAGSISQVGAARNYTPPTDEELGTLYYFVEVINTNTGVNGTQTASLKSSVVAVKITQTLTVTITPAINTEAFYDTFAALSPINTSGSITVAVSGLLDTVAANSVGLSLGGEGNGISFSGHLAGNGVYNAGTRTKTFTVKITYDGTTNVGDYTVSGAIIVYGPSPIPANYVYNDPSALTPFPLYPGEWPDDLNNSEDPKVIALMEWFTDPDYPDRLEAYMAYLLENLAQMMLIQRSFYIFDGFANLKAIRVNASNFAAFRTYITSAGLSKYYLLEEDVTASTAWTPIGSYSAPFTGTFDGNNHTVTGLTINSAGTTYRGMFSYIGSGGVVKNLGLINPNVTGNTGTSALAGQVNSGGTVERCYVINGTVTSAMSSIGLIVGSNSGMVDACFTTGTVSGQGSVGGIAGFSGGEVRNCWSSASVTGTGVGYTGTGGVVGYNSGTVGYCYSIGNVNGKASVGGVAGHNSGTMLRCYALNKQITATSNAGRVAYGGTGIASGGTLTYCYARVDMTCSGFTVGTKGNTYAAGEDLTPGPAVYQATTIGGLTNGYPERWTLGTFFNVGAQLPRLDSSKFGMNEMLGDLLQNPVLP